MDNTFHYYNFPNEIISYILMFLPYDKQTLLDKSGYIKYHKIKIQKQLKYSFDIYIKKIISKDYYFVFNLLLNDNLYKWIHIKKYRYNQIIFKNYIFFLQYLSYEMNAEKCLTIINNSIYNTGLDEKQHKNKINRNSIWIK